MTHNATISIAAKWLDDMNNSTLTDAQRATAKKNYTELIKTAGFPNKPDGSKMTYRAAIKTGVIFKDSKNKARAKEFLSFILQELNNENVWAKAMNRVLNEKVPVDKAVDEMIDRIKTVAR